MNAPMSRVFPTPVERGKQSEGKSRSKSVTVGNSVWMTLSDWATFACAASADRSAFFSSGMMSQTLARISSDSRWGGRRLSRLAIMFTLEFISHFQFEPPRRQGRQDNQTELST